MFLRASLPARVLEVRTADDFCRKPHSLRRIHLQRRKAALLLFQDEVDLVCEKDEVILKSRLIQFPEILQRLREICKFFAFPFLIAQTKRFWSLLVFLYN